MRKRGELMWDNGRKRKIGENKLNYNNIIN